MDRLNRPWCCPDPRCEPVHQLANGDPSIAAPGESFSCFGRMPEGIAFIYDGSDHANDLRSCHYTPLKGVIAWQENADDWRMLSRAYAMAEKRLSEHPGPPSQAQADARANPEEGSP